MSATNLTLCEKLIGEVLRHSLAYLCTNGWGHLLKRQFCSYS